MPVIKSAKKKLKQDKQRTKRNKLLNDLLKKALKNAKKLHTEKAIKEATSLLDKAVKNNLMHKNKASRIKSRFSKMVKKTTPKTPSAKLKMTPKTKAKKA